VEYITLPGWQTSIGGVRDYENLPENAKKYIETIEEYVQVPGTYARLLSSPYFSHCSTDLLSERPEFDVLQ
jgi:adenylosuccinate synthase